MKQAVVTVKGIQKDQTGDENTIELIAVGHSYRKNGKVYVMYEETELTGLAGTKTLLKISPEIVTLVRTGSVVQNQDFCLGQKMSSQYVTTYGRIDLKITTHVMNVQLDNSPFSIYIEYSLEMGGLEQSKNILSITVREEK